VILSSKRVLIGGLIVFLGCAAVASRAEARSLRTDEGGPAGGNNGWNACTSSSACPSLPAGLQFNPLGSDPASSPDYTSAFGGTGTYLPGGPDAQTPCADAGGSCTDDYDWSASVPGLMLNWSDSSNNTLAQVVYFDLSNQTGQTVYSPDATYDATTGDATNILGPSAGNTAWEIEFNYGDDIPSAASLYFMGTLYTASQSTLSPSNANEFVYYDGTLYAPDGWTVQPVPLPASLGLLAAALMLFAVLGWLRGRTIHSLVTLS